VSAVSFNGNKVLTTGGGGAILTNDEALGKLAKHLTTQAKIPHKWEFRHDMIGYNYRMPNLNAALGCAQLEQLPSFLERKRNLAERYKEAFAPVSGVSFVVEPDFSQSNYWLNAILLDEQHAHYRDDLLKKINDAGIMARPVWNLMYTLPMFKACPRMDCQTAESIARRLINIPSSVNL
jgi:perosamine synthetase